MSFNSPNFNFNAGGCGRKTSLIAPASHSAPLVGTYESAPDLSLSEHRVMALSAAGFEAAAIAGQVGMSYRTARRTLDTAAEKLGAKRNGRRRSGHNAVARWVYWFARRN